MMICKICKDRNLDKMQSGQSCRAVHIEEDEQGFFHEHNFNYRWQVYLCNNGHQFRVVEYNNCWCGWTSQYPDKVFHERKLEPYTDGENNLLRFSVYPIITDVKWITNLIELKKNEQ